MYDAWWTFVTIELIGETVEDRLGDAGSSRSGRHSFPRSARPKEVRRRGIRSGGMTTIRPPGDGHANGQFTYDDHHNAGLWYAANLTSRRHKASTLPYGNAQSPTAGVW